MNGFNAGEAKIEDMGCYSGSGERAVDDAVNSGAGMAGADKLSCLAVAVAGGSDETANVADRIDTGGADRAAVGGVAGDKADDYGRSRADSIFMTVSGDHSRDEYPEYVYFMSKACLDSGGMISVYEGLMLGGADRIFGLDELNKWLRRYRYSAYDMRIFLPVVHTCLEYAVYLGIQGERPGAPRMAELAAEEILSDDPFRWRASSRGWLSIWWLLRRFPGLACQETEIVLRQLAGFENVLNEYESLVRKSADCCDPEELTKLCAYIYGKVITRHFAPKHDLDPMPEWLDPDHAADDGDDESGRSRHRETHENPGRRLVYASGKGKEMLSELSLSEDDIALIPEYVVRNFGPSFKSGTEMERLERGLCTGIHENRRLHFTDGFPQAEAAAAGDSGLQGRPEVSYQISAADQAAETRGSDRLNTTGTSGRPGYMTASNQTDRMSASGQTALYGAGAFRAAGSGASGLNTAGAALESFAANMEFFRENESAANAGIRGIEAAFRNMLRILSEPEVYTADHGVLTNNALWKPGRVDDPKLFNKEFRRDEPSIVIDLLIDASGSQQKRESMVALQSYMFSAALSRIGIAHRVMSYCTYGDHTVLRRFRDYDDPASSDIRILEYHAGSNNRDGLAIAAAGSDLLKRKENRRLMLVLSDGLPNDMTAGRLKKGSPPKYVGDAAVRDTCFQLRILQRHGIETLGIFLGDDGELENERFIFGSSFLHIRHAEDFSGSAGRRLSEMLTR